MYEPRHWGFPWIQTQGAARCVSAPRRAVTGTLVDGQLWDITPVCVVARVLPEQIPVVGAKQSSVVWGTDDGWILLCFSLSGTSLSLVEIGLTSDGRRGLK